MRYWMPLFAVLSLAGCKTMDEAIAERDDAKCLSYGVQKGSQQYTDCRLQLERNRSSERAAALGGPPAPMPVLDAPMRQPTTCMRTGNMVTCN